MLNKLKFNNLVISNKRDIQQSRTQTINKVVHKIRKLNSILEKNPDNTKCKTKIRKFTETIAILKKLKRMDVIKQILLMDKPASAVITNDIATPEEIAVALLSINKIMQCLVKKFKMELQLNEVENVEWKKALMESSKRRLKIERNEQKRRKRLELKQKKALEHKRKEWLEENQPSMQTEKISVNTDCNVSTTFGWHIEELLSDNMKKTDKNFANACSRGIKSDIAENHFNKKSVAPNKPQKNKKENDCKKFKNRKLKEDIATDIELIAMKEKVKVFDKYQNESSNDAVESSSEPFVVDPFFITDSGESYMSVAVNNRGSSDQKRSINEYGIKCNSKRKKQKSQNKDDIEKNKLDYRKNIQLNQDYKPKEVLDSSNKSNLHPSWAAKQNLKPFIADFQGKKFKFDDNDCEKTNEYHIKTNKATESKPYKSPNEILHPSWAAKKKLKSSITTFQGKKICFDIDE